MDLTGNDSATASYDFENPINLAEDEGEDDCEVPGELVRLLLQEERVIQPHQESVESVNLGTETDKKEVKVGVNLELSVKQRLIQMLRDYVEIFAWSYEDMPGVVPQNLPSHILQDLSNQGHKVPQGLCSATASYTVKTRV